VLLCSAVKDAFRCYFPANLRLLPSLFGTKAIRSFTSMSIQDMHRRARISSRIVATATDGIIEGVEMPGANGFLLGVQWHPEEMTLRDAPSLALFKALVVAVSAVR